MRQWPLDLLTACQPVPASRLSFGGGFADMGDFHWVFFACGRILENISFRPLCSGLK